MDSALIEITVYMQKYQEAIRHVWNAYFMDVNQTSNFENNLEFFSVKKSLFRLLVLKKLDATYLNEEYISLDEYFENNQFMSCIIIKPLPGVDMMEFTSFIEGDTKGLDNFEHYTIKKNDVIEYCDFAGGNCLGFVDYSYIKGRLLKCESHPERIGEIIYVLQYCCAIYLDKNVVPKVANRHATQVYE